MEHMLQKPAACDARCVQMHHESYTCRNICCSRSCLATSLAEEPDTSIQVFENSAHADSMNTT